jgi:probable F420-dependent oxidoreductase
MKVGISLPCAGRIVSAEAMYRSAMLAEAVDLDSLWSVDRLIGPLEVSSRYPYTPDGRSRRIATEARLDPLLSLAVVAGVTSRIALGTGVLNIPYRDPITTAKALATLDLISGGRTILGAGLGWMKEEFKVLHVPYTERAARTEEYLAICKALWTEEIPAFSGRFYQFADIKFEPKPVQRPHPPIWIGGYSEPAIRRALRIGDGWHPSRLAPGEFEERMRSFREHAAASRRDLGNFTVSLKVGFDVCPGPDVALRYRDLGVQHLVIDFWTDDLDELLRQIEFVGSTIAPAVRA